MIIIEYGKDIFLEGKKVRVKGEESSIHFSREGVHIAAELWGGNLRISIGSPLLLIKASAVIVYLRPLENIIKPEVFCIFICFKHV